MSLNEHWVSGGKMVPRPYDEQGKPCSDRFLLQHDFVKIEIHKLQINIRWQMAGANWASLIYLHSWISAFEGPFQLSFFNAGWFEETYPTSEKARMRIVQLIAKSDVRLSSRVYTRDFLGSTSPVAMDLIELLKQGKPDEDKAVICEIDTNASHVEVRQIGKQSVLAGIWGEAHVSYPCQTGHSYDKIVSKAYFRALNENRPIYDQVLASMVKPDGNIHWIGYQRVIFPHQSVNSKAKYVSVNCALAPVDIPLF